jgi:hypothetical protein
MSSDPLPFAVPDLSSFARALGAALKARHSDTSDPPGHVETLNIIARALGQRNVQSLRVALQAAPAARREPPPPTPLSANARKTLAQFDAEGRLLRWPNKFTVQKMAMWILWTLFDAKRLYTEREVNTILKAANAFGDHVTLRRELINHRLMARKSDCSEYRKLAVRPDDEIRALLHAWRARR